MLHHQNLIKLTIFAILLLTCHSLTASQVTNQCHCDLHPQICDIDCCCDLNCNNPIPDSCFRAKSSKYCITPQDYFRINTNFYTENSCYYYNSSNTQQQQVLLTSNAQSIIIASNQLQRPLSSSIADPYKGYKRGDLFNIGGKNSFQLVDSNGNCLLTASTGRVDTISFGRDLYVKCNCLNCGTQIPLIFTEFINKTILQYFTDTTVARTLTTLSQIPSNASSVTLNFIIGKYGTGKVNFIKEMTSSVIQSTSTSMKKLIIKFIDETGRQDKIQAGSPSFFPQIPADMFYPIYLF